jgi:predicted RNA-binding protein with RPS1 domain
VKDLKEGMMAPGIVTNVTNFGAFVDIGVHQDGLVHLSQLADRFVKDPREVVSPGDRVQVRVLDINLEKNQIALSMKGLQAHEKPGAGRAPRAERPAGGGGNQPRRAPQGGRGGRDQNAQQAQRAPHDRRPEHSGPKIPLKFESKFGAGSITKPAPGSQSRDGGRHDRKPSGPQKPFNNAFAGLASLKDALKK